MPKTWATAHGMKIELVGGTHPGQWLRMPEPYENVIPMPDGTVFDLTKNHPGYKYEWCYVLRPTREATT